MPLNIQPTISFSPSTLPRREKRRTTNTPRAATTPEPAIVAAVDPAGLIGPRTRVEGAAAPQLSKTCPACVGPRGTPQTGGQWTCFAWPLGANHAVRLSTHAHGKPTGRPTGADVGSSCDPTPATLSWWAGEDSNLRRLCRLIYSQLPLATRAPTQVGRR